MDTIAHGLWAGAAAKAVNKKLAGSRRAGPINVRWAIFWGAFPDLLAFTLPIGAVLAGLFSGYLPGDIFTPDPNSFSPAPQTAWTWEIASILYPPSHSVFVFLGMFALVWIIKRRPYWEMSGWLFHILLDIPTHSPDFYPTPFLWPVSDFKTGVFSWTTLWFVTINYAAIALAFWLVRKKKPSQS